MDNERLGHIIHLIDTKKIKLYTNICLIRLKYSLPNFVFTLVENGTKLTVIYTYILNYNFRWQIHFNLRVSSFQDDYD